MDVDKLENIAYKRRIDVWKMIYNAKTGHVGGTFSSLDILTTLFYRVFDIGKIKSKEKDRDRFILSKGHTVEGYYAILGDLGLFPKNEIETFGKFNTRLAGHPTIALPGVEANTGSLGHGLGIGVGMAIGNKKRDVKSKIVVLMGDGEQGEGSVWEAAMSASMYNLDNLYLIVDRNGLQISGNTEDVMALEPLDKKYENFGFEVHEIDGHNYEEIYKSMSLEHNGKPKIIIANTIKGKGISFIENQKNWHHKVPNEEEYKLGLRELKEKIL